MYCSSSCTRQGYKTKNITQEVNRSGIISRQISCHDRNSELLKVPTVEKEKKSKVILKAFGWFWKYQSLFIFSWKSLTIAGPGGACVYCTWDLLGRLRKEEEMNPVQGLFIHGGPRINFSVFLYCSPPYLLRQGLSMNLALTDSARVTGQQLKESWLCLSGLGFSRAPCALAFYMGFGKSKLRWSCLSSKHFTHWAITPAPPSPQCFYVSCFEVNFLVCWIKGSQSVCALRRMTLRIQIQTQGLWQVAKSLYHSRLCTSFPEPGMMMNAYNGCTQNIEAGRLPVWGQTGLQSLGRLGWDTEKFQTSHRVRTCLEQIKIPPNSESYWCTINHRYRAKWLRTLKWEHSGSSR